LIGVPLDMGGSRRGVDMGPSAFRIAGLSEQITALGRVVVDRGDLPSPIPETKKHGDPRKKFIKEIAKVCDRVYQAARASIEEGAIPLVLGRRSQPRRRVGCRIGRALRGRHPNRSGFCGLTRTAT
jgi:arginase